MAANKSIKHVMIIRSLCVFLFCVIPIQARATTAQRNPIIVSFQNEISTLDPAIGYDWQNTDIISAIFDGLFRYQHHTGELELNLAESHQVSPGGLKHTFTLRKDLRFHNGRKLIAADIKYSMERMLHPDTLSPGQHFYKAIEGFKDYSQGKTDHLSGIQLIDDHTVTFTLAYHDATFLNVLALNFARIVPREAVERPDLDFGKHPVGTGSYQLEEWLPGQHLLISRNHHYHHDDLPKAEAFQFRFGLTPTRALQKYKQGEVDILGDGIPSGSFARMINDPRYRNNIAEGRQHNTSYIAMNTRIPPFDDKRVRQAINHAIDKHHIVKLIDFRAIPASQILPPAMDGYIRHNIGYQYDPYTARALLATSGFANGFDARLYCSSLEPNPSIARAIKADLAEIGVRVELHCLDQDTVIRMGGKPDEAAMIWSGGMAWIADFPDPSNFYGPILGCSGAIAGGWNWSWYCNEDLEISAQKANAMSGAKDKLKRMDLWKSIFKTIMEDAPWVPVFNEQDFILYSSRVHMPRNSKAEPTDLNYPYIRDTQSPMTSAALNALDTP